MGAFYGLLVMGAEGRSQIRDVGYQTRPTVGTSWALHGHRMGTELIGVIEVTTALRAHNGCNISLGRVLPICSFCGNGHSFQNISFP